MKKVKIKDLNLLSDELYLQAIEVLHLDRYKRKSQKYNESDDLEIWQSLGLTIEEKRELLKDLESLGDLSFSISFWKNTPYRHDEEIINGTFNDDYTASKILILIKQIDQLIENYNQQDA